MAISNNASGIRPGVCTSTTRPTAPYEGQHIYETDTDVEYVWNGSAWVVNYVSANNPTFTGTVSGITKSMVGLGSVDNTADTAKPVSTAQQTALNLKANIASPALTGTPTAPTASAGTNTTQIATMASRPWNTAWGLVTLATLAAGTGYITPTTDLISVTFTAVAGRRYRYFATGLIVNDGVGPMSTHITDSSNNVIREYFTYFAVAGGVNYQTGFLDYVETFASSGSVTRKLRHNSSAMGVYYYGAAVRDPIAWKFSVEDIGPA
jgi:hypothetical protein